MRDKLIFTLIAIGCLVGCSEEELPAGIYDYQVERLLTGESGSKTWLGIINSESCSDSIKLTFELVTTNSIDSIDISRLTGNSDCIFETVYIGRANASSDPDRILFTDSLLFASGDFWIVREITSLRLSLEESNKISTYQGSN